VSFVVESVVPLRQIVFIDYMSLMAWLWNSKCYSAT